jgi:hypothetical protein
MQVYVPLDILWRYTTMAKTKSTGFYFKCSPEEMAWMERRRTETGISNMSAFIRKMCIDGHVIQLDLPELNEVGRLIRITANNTNQIARRVNSGGEAYREDVAELNNQSKQILTSFGKLLTSLSDLIDPKPGKRFIPPLTIRDIKPAEGA